MISLRLFLLTAPVTRKELRTWYVSARFVNDVAGRCILRHRCLSRRWTGPIVAFVDDLIPWCVKVISFPRSFAWQTHKVWPNMDTSPLNEWHTGLVGISAWRRIPSRRRVSRGTPVPHQTCITTHTRFHIVTIALPPRCTYAGCLTSREGRIEARQSLHVILRIHNHLRINGHWYCNKN